MGGVVRNRYQIDRLIDYISFLNLETYSKINSITNLLLVSMRLLKPKITLSFHSKDQHRSSASDEQLVQ